MLLFVCFSLACAFAPLPQASAAPYVYNFHGPYYDNGEVATDSVFVSLSLDGVAPLSFYLTGDGVTAEDYTVNSNYAGTVIFWNSSTALNLTRSYSILSSDNGGDIYVFITKSDAAVQTYYFAVTDYTGSAAYLQSSVSNGITDGVVERKDIGVSGTVSFVMTQYRVYTLTVINVNGSSFSQSFSAENVLSMNLPILPGSFPLAVYGSGAVASASRFNATAVSVNYTDSEGLTDWVYFEIYHRDGLNTLTDYAYNSSSVPATLLWTGADSGKEYTVYVEANYNSSLLAWYFGIPTVNTNSNPWAGVLNPFASSNPTLPISNVLPKGFAVEQIPAALLIAFVLAIFSYANHEVGCLLSWVFAAIMVYLGWFTVSLPAFGFALFLSVLIAFTEGKKTEREL